MAAVTNGRAGEWILEKKHSMADLCPMSSLKVTVTDWKLPNISSVQVHPFPFVFPSILINFTE